MKTFFLAIFGLLMCLPYQAIAQEEEDPESKVLDSLYREDQFYLGFTYNFLSNMPRDVDASRFSGGIHFGFIRDFPINAKRNLALGIGLGWSIDTYGQNLFIGNDQTSGETVFQVLNDNLVDYNYNRFSTQSIDLPFEFRWRTSNAESHKFWRVYTGVRLGYVYYFRSSFEQENNRVRQTNIPELNRLHTGLSLAFGYNTFNFYVYYSLTPFFYDSAKLNGESIQMNHFDIGLMFYIL